MEQTRHFLTKHANQYPAMQIEDCFKALYQSVFGCEHLVADPSAAAEFIRQEAACCTPHEGSVVEPLDGPFCRVHLDILHQGLSPDTFSHLFAQSAKYQYAGEALLEEKLSALTALAAEGSLPFSVAEAEEKIKQWRSSGFPACHHSATFRETYHPAYRLLKRDYALFLPLFAKIDQMLAERTSIFLAIDGNSAGGKSTLAQLLSEIYDCAVVHMDDFFLRPEQRTPERYAEPGGNVDRERFLSEVLAPLRAGKAVDYRRFDCQTLTLLPPVPLSPARVNIAEGSYSMHPELAAYYDLSVFLHISPEVQQTRILHRNGSAMAERFFSTWIPLEQTYFDTYRIDKQCDFCFDTGSFC